METNVELAIEIIPNSLSSLADEINNADKNCQNSFKYTLGYAIYAGECLLKAKELCGHGNWLKWRAQNIKHPERTSERYMQLARNKSLLLSNSPKLANLTMDGALRLLKSGTSMLQSMSNDWWTPKKYMDAVHEVMGHIDLDPCSTPEANKTIRARKFYTERDDGLIQPWFGKVFMNPPYGTLTSAFAEKFYLEYGSTVEEAIILVNSRATDADWFQPMFEGVICFTDHRIDFDSPYEKQTSSTHGSCFIYFGANDEKFAEVFARFGNIVKRYP